MAVFGDYKLGYQLSLNYRAEHKFYLEAMKPNGRLFTQLKNNHSEQPIDAGNFIWIGNPTEMVTILTQRAITGLECFFPFALTTFATVKFKNGIIERLVYDLAYESKPEKILKIMDERFPKHNFTKNNRKKIVHLLYRCLPLIVGVEKEIPKELFCELCVFYHEVRNKIAHGAVVTKAEPEPLLITYELIEKVYLWIETWMPAGIKSGGFQIQWR